jgi:crescentin
MNRFSFLARKTVPAEQPAEKPIEPATVNLLEVDAELFCSRGAQFGGDNEALRNLLIYANHKISGLPAIMDAVGRLVDPVSKALRDFETEKSEKHNLQTVLNNTRTAYDKLRKDMTALEKKAGTFERECLQLRQDFTFAQNAERTLEAARVELTTEITARRARIADLEGRLAQETTDSKALRDESRRLGERLVTANKRTVQLEADLNNARQKLAQSEDEKRTLQGSLDKSIADGARLSRRLAEAESSLIETQGRLRHVEANFAEINTERERLAAALNELNERHNSEHSTQQLRFEALQTRAATTDKLLLEARDHMTARAEEARVFDRRLSETTHERDALAARLAIMENERIQRESEQRENEQAHATLLERSSALAKVYNSKESALALAEETIKSLNERIGSLETQLQASKEAAEQQIEDSAAALRREKLERSVAEGALETARKDFARVMREVMSLQRQKTAEEPAPTLRSANAA